MSTAPAAVALPSLWRNLRTPEEVTFHELLEPAPATMDCGPTMVRYASSHINRTLGRHAGEVAAKAA